MICWRVSTVPVRNSSFRHAVLIMHGLIYVFSPTTTPPRCSVSCCRRKPPHSSLQAFTAPRPPLCLAQEAISEVWSRLYSSSGEEAVNQQVWVSMGKQKQNGEKRRIVGSSPNLGRIIVQSSVGVEAIAVSVLPRRETGWLVIHGRHHMPVPEA